MSENELADLDLRGTPCKAPTRGPFWVPHWQYRMVGCTDDDDVDDGDHDGDDDDDEWL